MNFFRHDIFLAGARFDAGFSDDDLSSASSPSSCPAGSFKCLLAGIHEFSRSMDEVAYQLDMSDTIDSGNVTGLEDHDDDDDDTASEDDGEDVMAGCRVGAKADSSYFAPEGLSGRGQRLRPVVGRSVHRHQRRQQQRRQQGHQVGDHGLCRSCSSAMPVVSSGVDLDIRGRCGLCRLIAGLMTSCHQELEGCLDRCRSIMAGSAFSLQRTRKICRRLMKLLRRARAETMEKQVSANQLQEALASLRQKAERAEDHRLENLRLRDELEGQQREVKDIREKLNENYRLVAGLSSENLKLSTEKLKADDLVAEVIKDQARLRSELHKALDMLAIVRRPPDGMQSDLGQRAAPPTPSCHRPPSSSSGGSKFGSWTTTPISYTY